MALMTEGYYRRSGKSKEKYIVSYDFEYQIFYSSFINTRLFASKDRQYIFCLIQHIY